MRDGRDRDRTLRGRVDGLEDDQGRRWAPAPDSPPSFVGKTKAIVTYPTSAKAWYGIDPCSISGDEAEGTVATIASRGLPVVRARNLGTAIPPAGTEVLVARDPGGRWVFSYS